MDTMKLSLIMSPQAIMDMHLNVALAPLGQVRPSG